MIDQIRKLHQDVERVFDIARLISPIQMTISGPLINERYESPRLILNYAAQKCEYHRISRASITVNPVIWRGGVPSPILVDPNDNAPFPAN